MTITRSSLSWRPTADERVQQCPATQPVGRHLSLTSSPPSVSSASPSPSTPWWSYNCKQATGLTSLPPPVSLVSPSKGLSIPCVLGVSLKGSSPPPVILVSPSKGLRHLLWPWRFPRCLHHPLRPWCLPQSVFTTSCDLGAFLTVSPPLPLTLAPSSQCLHHFLWPWRLPHSVFTISCDHGV